MGGGQRWRLPLSLPISQIAVYTTRYLSLFASRVVSLGGPRAGDFSLVAGEGDGGQQLVHRAHVHERLAQPKELRFRYFPVACPGIGRGERAEGGVHETGRST